MLTYRPGLYTSCVILPFIFFLSTSFDLDFHLPKVYGRFPQSPLAPASMAAPVGEGWAGLICWWSGIAITEEPDSQRGGENRNTNIRVLPHIFHVS